jgi:hypothetical protein
MLFSDSWPIGNEPDAADVLEPTCRSFFFLKQHYNITWPPGPDGAPPAEGFLDEKLVIDLLKILAETVPMDDAWYRERYVDVEDGIRKGQFKGAKHHYVEFGYFEDGPPQYVKMNHEYYRATYPDIAEHLDAGRLSSSQKHFETHGFNECRLPRSEWRLIG